MTIYRTENRRAIAEILPEERLSNQVVFYGNSGNVLSIPKGAFFLELLIVEGAGTVEVKDGDGKIVASGVTDFSQDHSPLRCDKGITLTGSIAIAKGFVVENLFVL
jgi:hypothetical protein